MRVRLVRHLKPFTVPSPSGLYIVENRWCDEFPHATTEEPSRVRYRELVTLGMHRALLAAKLHEELGEFSYALNQGSSSDIRDEAADVMEVMRTITTLSSVPWVSIIRAMEDKVLAFGGFAIPVLYEEYQPDKE